MDESLKQQILAVDLLRPHSIYFSNCSYLLRGKKKSKQNFVITQYSPCLSPLWAGTQGPTIPAACCGSPLQDRPLAFAGRGFNCRMGFF